MDFNYPVSQSWFAHYERTGRMLLQKCGVRINLAIYIYITIRQDLNFATLFNSPIHDFLLTNSHTFDRVLFSTLGRTVNYGQLSSLSTFSSSLFLIC